MAVFCGGVFRTDFSVLPQMDFEKKEEIFWKRIGSGGCFLIGKGGGEEDFLLCARMNFARRNRKVGKFWIGTVYL